MNGKERILKALRRETPDRIPTFEWFIDTGVGKALTGSDDVVDIVEKLDVDGINIRLDYEKKSLTKETFADEWGSVRKLTGDAIPAIIEYPIKDINDSGTYVFPDLQAPQRFASIEKALKTFGDSRAVILNIRDGFSDMRDLLGYENALVNMMVEQEAFSDLLKRVVDYNLEAARIGRERYGLEVIGTTDDVANGDGLLMSPDTYYEMLGSAFKELFGGYKSMGYMTVKHCDGDVRPLVDFWIEAGIDCLDPIDPGANLDMGEMKKAYGDRICLKGNIDCTGNLCDGSPEDVAAEVENCIAKGGGGGGLILSSSNTIHRGVKPENYKAMLDTLHDKGRY